MTKIREIIEKYKHNEYVEIEWMGGNCTDSDECILARDFDKLEEELMEYIDKNYRKIYGSHDVDEFYKDEEKK